MKKKNYVMILVAVVATIGLSMTIISFTTSNQSGTPSLSASSPSANDKYRTFVKTKNKCQKSNCSCSGYWGYKHGNGTYEGNCQNTDGHGHTCGHGPEKHGLKKW